MSIISVTNSKGSVGKTTLVANLAGFLADRGNRVLVVDADIPPTLSSYYPLSRRAKNGLRFRMMTVNISRTALYLAPKARTERCRRMGQ